MKQPQTNKPKASSTNIWVAFAGVTITVIAISSGIYWWQNWIGNTKILKHSKKSLPKIQPPTVFQKPQPTQTPKLETTLSQTSKTSDWKTYRNKKYGYTLQYPPNYSLKDDIVDLVRLGEQKVGRGIEIFAEGDLSDTASLSFTEFAIERAKSVCDVGTALCESGEKPVRQKSFTNPHGIKGLELYLRQKEQRFDKNTRTYWWEERVIGPVFVLDISKPTQNLARTLRLNLRIEMMWHPDDADTLAYEDVLRTIVDTVRF